MSLPVRRERKSAVRTLHVWWWWTARTCFLTPSLWSAGSATWICSLETGSCWESASTASASQSALGHEWAVSECWIIVFWVYVCVFLSWAESAYVQSSCWVKSRRCRVPTEMRTTPVPACCRRERSELWVTQMQCLLQLPGKNYNPTSIAATLVWRLSLI